jgi:hypothetical protein
VKLDVRCICPVQTAHRDTITLSDKLDFRGAMACRQAVRFLKLQDPDASEGDMLGTLTEHYVIHGIEDWTAQEADERGKLAPVPVTGGNIRRLVLPYWDIAMEVADAADNLYTEAILLPLLGVAPNSSPPTPTDESTSAASGSTPSSSRPSRRSSISTIPTADTATTSKSLDGDSSSSQSSKSAA